MPLYPGDPLTPGVGATPDAKRLDADATGDDADEDSGAADLLRRRQPLLAGARRPGGADGLARRAADDVSPRPRAGEGASEAGVRLDAEADLRRHRHAARAASGPTSGSSAATTTTRGSTAPPTRSAAWSRCWPRRAAVGALAKSGWTPKRTIVYAAWDGEEPGLLGSTEWAETHADELQQKAVVYINSDGNGRGFLGAGGSHALETVRQRGRARRRPIRETSVSVGERAQAARDLDAAHRGRPQGGARARRTFAIGALGSGSDYTPFLQHLGIASLNIGFGGEGERRHLPFDLRLDSTTTSASAIPASPTASRWRKTAGRAVLRLADAERAAARFRRASPTRSTDTCGEVAKLAATMRDKADERNRGSRGRPTRSPRIRKETYVAPAPEAPVPFLNFAPLQNAGARLKAAADEFDQRDGRLEERARIARARHRRATGRRS